MFIGSFQNIYDVIALPPKVLPHDITGQNYVRLLKELHGIQYWCRNTGIIVIGTVLLSLTSTALAGYAFAVWHFPAKQIIYWVFLLSIIIPGTALFIPKFVVIRGLALSGTYWAVILPGIFSAFHILLFRNFVQHIPQDIHDSARIDGASEWWILLRVILPLCKPVLGTLALFISLGVMGDYMWQFLMLHQDETKMTMIVGVIAAIYRKVSIQMELNPVGLKLAAGVVLFVPSFVIFCFFQRYFKGEFLAGGVKL